MVLGGIVWLLYNLPIFWILPNFLPEGLGYWAIFGISLAYFLIIPAITFICMYSFAKRMAELYRLTSAKKRSLEQFVARYKKLRKEVETAGF